ncbi:hypothetical protein MPS_2268 [Mycobacterium pseudoshottsii JCM 15466]|nr:hypothetical protein MPS_2268 [Mycobacterium pseudoshottsii JCM 15466]
MVAVLLAAAEVGLGKKVSISAGIARPVISRLIVRPLVDPSG